MSTPIESTPVPACTIPLPPEVRSAYQGLYDKIQAAIDGTMDAAALEALNRWQPEVDQVLTQDDEYKLSHDTNIFAALQNQIQCVNKGLAELRSQIASIASHFEMAGDIVAAIDKILSLFP